MDTEIQLFAEQLRLRLPDCPTNFSDFAFRLGYQKFVEDVQKLNNNSASRTQVETAWARIIHQKYTVWKSKDVTKTVEVGMRLRSRALKQMRGSDTWSKTDIKVYWKGIKVAASIWAAPKQLIETNAGHEDSIKDEDEDDEFEIDRFLMGRTGFSFGLGSNLEAVLEEEGCGEASVSHAMSKVGGYLMNQSDKKGDGEYQIEDQYEVNGGHEVEDEVDEDGFPL